MTFTIGSFSCNFLTSQPLSYDGDARKGLTAPQFRLNGLLTPTEWQDLIGVYDTWRDARIQDPDSVTSNSIGSTVNFSGSANGLTWSAIPCWFTDAPSGEQIGAYIQASVSLVDAAKSLEALQKEPILASARYTFGSFNVGSTQLQLLKPPQTFQDTPTLALTATGTSYITGPLTATRVLQLEGYTDATGWADILTWYETTIATTPATDDLFPIEPPSATAEGQIINGVRTDLYTVSVTLGQVK
jgi:hypothetical protein